MRADCSLFDYGDRRRQPALPQLRLVLPARSSKFSRLARRCVDAIHFVVPSCEPLTPRWERTLSLDLRNLSRRTSLNEKMVSYILREWTSGKCCFPLPWRKRHRRWCIGGNFRPFSSGGRLEGARRYDLIHWIESFWGWRFSSPRRWNSRGFSNTPLLAEREQVASNSRVHALH